MRVNNNNKARVVGTGAEMYISTAFLVFVIVEHIFFYFNTTVVIFEIYIHYLSCFDCRIIYLKIVKL
jgi:hypothetical protein